MSNKFSSHPDVTPPGPSRDARRNIEDASGADDLVGAGGPALARETLLGGEASGIVAELSSAPDVPMRPHYDGPSRHRPHGPKWARRGHALSRAPVITLDVVSFSLRGLRVTATAPDATMTSTVPVHGLGITQQY